jgi:hypothetical protein
VTVLVVSSLLVGLVLGRFFTWFVLLPVGFTAVILIAASSNASHYNFLNSCLQFGALSISLQVGYVFGAIILFSIRAFGADSSTENVVPRNADSPTRSILEAGEVNT